MLGYARFWAYRRNIAFVWPAIAFSSSVALAVVGAVMGEQTPGVVVVASVTGVLLLAFWSSALFASLRIQRLWRLLDRYAEASGGHMQTLTYASQPSEALDARGEAGLSRTLLTLPSGVTIGDWEYLRTGNQPGTRSAYTWGYISIPLATTVPHLVLDSRRNRRAFTIRAGTDLFRSQVISLEGDFDRHFTVYGPNGYEADALYFLTPDVMSDLIDTAPEWDVEFVDEHVVFFRPGPILTADETELESLVAFATGWSRRAEAWSRWRDPRLDATPRIDSRGILVSPPRGIHSSGTRLDGSRLMTITVGVFVLILVGMYAAAVIGIVPR